MKFSNRFHMFTGDYFLGYPCFKSVRLSEIPKDYIEIRPRRFMPPPKPWTPIVDNSIHTSQQARKLSPRGGIHRRYRAGKFASCYDNSSHKVAKTLAHRAARRKARIYFRQIDPDSDYNARLNPGLTEWEFC